MVFGPVSVAIVALLLQLVAAETGARLGERRATADEGLRTQTSAVEAAVLGLLGLLLAFSFSLAVTRYEMRRSLVVNESNAIGTAWLRADALPPPEDTALRRRLQRYIDTRLAFFTAGEDPAAVASAVAQAEKQQDEIWAIVARASADEPTSLPRALLLESVNAVIDVHGQRLEAFEARVPYTVPLLLVVVAAVALGTVGYGYGVCRGRHRGASVLLATLVAAILYVILDLDEPRRGPVQVSQESLRHLKATLDAAPPNE